MTGADEPTRQPPAYRPIGPMRAALVLAMAVVIGGSLVRNAPLRRQAAQRARAASELISANAQTRLACFYASLEAQGAPTRNRLIDAMGFPGKQASRALAESAIGQYEDAARKDPSDWQATANAAILYGYLGRDYDGVLTLQEGLSISNIPEYWLLFRTYAREAPKKQWLQSPELASLKKLAAWPLLGVRLYTDLGEPDEAADALESGARRAEGLLVFIFAIAALAAAGVGVVIGFLILRPWRRPVPGPEASWSVFLAVEVLVPWMLVSVAAGWAAGMIPSAGRLSPVLLNTGIYVLAAAAALAWFLLASLPGGRRTFAALGWRSGRGALAGIGGYCAALPVLALVWLVMRLLLPNATPASLALPIVAGATRLLDRITAAALAVVIAPLVEETLFRGIFYGALRSRMRPVLAMAVSGAVFGLVHLDLVAAVPLTALGMILAYLYERTGSLTAPAVAHGLVNAAAVALTLVM